MKKLFVIPFSMLTAVALTACSGGSGDTPDEPKPVTPPQKKEINISTSIGTRVTDDKFDTNDRVGLYVVNYNGSTPGTLANSGNHVNNMRFTYNGTWTPDQQIYWKDETTRADFYLYYPYASISSVTAVPFEVKTNQSTADAYKSSEFLGGKTANVAPSSSAVSITAKHLMSAMEVTVAPGDGFTSQSLAASNVSVSINNLKTGSSINLTDFTITASGDAKTVQPLSSNGVYKAIVVPQTVAECNLITVNIDGKDYNLKKGFTFESGKLHKFTVTVAKTSNGINVSISAWETDGQDNGGTAV